MLRYFAPCAPAGAGSDYRPAHDLTRGCRLGLKRSRSRPGFNQYGLRVTWEPKPGAPATFSLAAAFRALVTGDAAYAWTDQFLPLLGAENYDTDVFCRAGPPSVGFTIDPSDFLNMTPRTIGRLPLLLGSAAIDQVRVVAQDRVFGAYCQNTPAPGAGWCTIVDETIAGDGGYQFIGGSAPYLDVPAGATHFHSTLTVGGATTAPDVILGFVNPANGHTDYSETLSSFHGVTQVMTLPAGLPHFYVQMHSIVDTIHVVIDWDCPDAYPVDYTFTPPTAPPGLVARTPTAGTLDAIAAELDAQETKLDFLVAGVQYLTQSLAIPTDPDATVIDAPAGTELDVSSAAGCIVSLNVIRAGANEHFGTPPTYTKLGEIVFSGHGGLGPVIELRTNPQLVFPMPPGAQGMTVNALPPATATVKLIPKLK